MKRGSALLFFTAALPLSAIWNYDYNPRPGTPNLSGLDSNVFNQNGTIVYGSPGSGDLPRKPHPFIAGVFSCSANSLGVR